MSRTIKAIERHMNPQSKVVPVQSRAAELVAEWQQRGPETLSGHALRKLRLATSYPGVYHFKPAQEKGETRQPEHSI